MSYIDTEYYLNVYGGTESEDYDRLFERASDIIDNVTSFRIKQIGFDNLSDFAKEQVRRAAAAQAEHMEKSGGVSDTDSNSAVQMTLGRFSYMKSSGTAERRSGYISSTALAALEPTGLLCRSIGIGGG